MDYYTIILHDQIMDVEESGLDNGILFVFRLTEGTEMLQKEDISPEVILPTQEEILLFGLKFNTLVVGQETIKHLNVLFNMV